jgi:hypothetical protein
MSIVGAESYCPHAPSYSFSCLDAFIACPPPHVAAIEGLYSVRFVDNDQRRNTVLRA